MELIYDVKNYEWGKIGLDSKVAKLSSTSNNHSEESIDPLTPYAELWMGTHPSGPSYLKTNGLLLSKLIRKRPEYLGEPIRLSFGDESLPFLFKVLSINKALSIQAHPSKEHAKQLHSERPDLYKDPNHKPELAIALTPFEALCGFRTFPEIRAFVKDIKELRAILGTDLSEKVLKYESTGDNEELDAALIKECFVTLMTRPDDLIAKLLEQLIEKFSTVLNQNERKKQAAPLIERLYAQFPGDVGCFSVYFLNVVHLRINEALYLGPNVPHAYLSGDCVECMACSDNVVRAGLTPKFRDVETLCEMLDYKPLPLDLILFAPVVESSECVVYRPPVADFAVVKHEVPAEVEIYRPKHRNSASILLVVAGYGECKSVKLHSGVALFVPANEKLVIHVYNNMLMFQAMMNVKDFV